MRSWTVMAVLGVAAVVGMLSIVPFSTAQRDAPVIARPTPLTPGRFICAHGSATRVLVLDTATGQVYSIGEAEFKPAAALPKIGEIGRVPDRGRGDGDRPPLLKEKERPKERRDEEKPKDREKPKERPPFEKEER